jgi:hypothetical protein
VRRISRYLIVLMLLASAAPAEAKVGTLTQLHGKAGCVAQPDAPGLVKEECTVARLERSRSAELAVSPDHRNLYVAGSDSISVFRINHGRLHQLRGRSGCVISTSIANALGCKRVQALGGPADVAVSPDGRNVYVASFYDPYAAGAVLVFDRNVKGGAVRLEGTAAARGVDSVITRLLVSSDGRTLYVASHDARNGIVGRGSVAVFARKRDGGLTQLAGPAGCLNTDGFDGCTRARGLQSTCCQMALSPDMRNLYLSSSNVTQDYSSGTRTATPALTAFTRSPFDGGLTQLAGTAGCVNTDGSDGCAAVALLGDRPLNEAAAPIISPNGRNLYLAHSSSSLGMTGPCGGADSFVALFDRDPGSGVLGPLRQDLPTCGSAELMSPDGRSMYATGGESGWTLSALSRNRTTGVLAAAGCMGHRASGCRDLRHVKAPEALASDGKRYVYVVSNDVAEGTTIGVFRR